MIDSGVKRVTEKTIERNLYNPEMPDPDLVIRTSGESRVSNFLLWELAYSELVFSDTLARFLEMTYLMQLRSIKIEIDDLAVLAALEMALYRDDGIVLRRWKLGESDRIVVI